MSDIKVTISDAAVITAQIVETGNIETTLLPGKTQSAAGMPYNNSTSGLAATDVQGAIDENKTDILSLENDKADLTYVNSQLADIENRVQYSKNLFNPTDPTIQIGKGFSGTTGTIVDASPYNVSGFIEASSGDKVFLSQGGINVSRPNYYKIASYDQNKLWLSTQAYLTTGITLPLNTAFIRVQFDNTPVGLLQIEIGTAITPYEAWHLPRTKRENLPPSLKESINGKKWVSYGDSITAQNKWQPSVSSFHELLHTNLGVGSTTMSLIASRETEYPCFVNATRIQAIKDANPDIVTIMGGTNDSHLEAPVGTSAELTKAIESKDKTNFYGAYSFLIETLLTWKPTLKIMLMSTQQGIYDTSRPYKYKDYADATKAIAQFYSLPCADVFGESGISKYNMAAYSTDLIHPNDEGGKLIANVVATTMEKIAKF